MKLRKVIAQLETQECINAETFAELKKRKKQVKAYFGLEKIEGVAEVIGNALTMYYIDIEERGISDLIYNNDLEESCETGHVLAVIV